jgi:hypothetical protein
MSTLEIRTATMPPRLLPSGLARVVAVMASIFDAFVEAQEQARAAHARYPFVD